MQTEPQSSTPPPNLLPEPETPLLPPTPQGSSSGARLWISIALALGCLSLGLGAFYAITFNSKSENAATVSTRNQPITSDRAISALGRLEPEGEVIRVASPSGLGSARVAKLMVKEGDFVQKGQILAQLDSYERSQAELLSAQSQVREQESILAQVKAGAKAGDISAQRRQVLAAEANLQRLQAEYQIAQSDLQRYESLYRDGAVSAITLDSFRLRQQSLEHQIKQAEQQVEQAKAQLTSIAEVRPTDIQIAEARLQTALLNVRRAAVNVELSQVRSPISGQVLKIHAKEGENISPNEGLLELGNTRQMYAVAEVYETEIGNVRVGQKAEVSSEAFAGVLTGTVERVGLRVAKNDVLGTDPAARTDVRVVEVKIRLDDSSQVSGLSNLQVTVRILP
jgi:HlyD family secretion protein